MEDEPTAAQLVAAVLSGADPAEKARRWEGAEDGDPIAMIEIKKGVQPPLVHLVAAVANVFERQGLEGATITSVIDGKHSEWSGHYQLRALDLRTRGLSLAAADLVHLCSLLKSEAVQLMGVEYGRIYCAVHDAGTRNEHIHMQFK